jgi:hypothetical protein
LETLRVETEEVRGNAAQDDERRYVRSDAGWSKKHNEVACATYQAAASLPLVDSSASFKPRERELGSGTPTKARASCGAACCARTRNRGLLHVVGGELGEGVGGRFFEASETAAEDEADFVGGAVALLGDLDFGLIALFG